jgi:hypothetical protein
LSLPAPELDWPEAPLLVLSLPAPELDWPEAPLLELPLAPELEPEAPELDC